MSVCPNCGRPVETHEMFQPPRCPVVRLRFPADHDPLMVSYSAWSAQPNFTADEQAWLDAEQERRSRPSGWMTP